MEIEHSVDLAPGVARGGQVGQVILCKEAQVQGFHSGADYIVLRPAFQEDHVGIEKVFLVIVAFLIFKNLFHGDIG